MPVMESRPILLFDVMGTLVHDPVFCEVPRFFGKPIEELFKELDPTSWVDFEHGHIDEATYLRRLFRDGRLHDEQGFREAMRTGYRWLDGVEELLGELRAEGAVMHVLSNYPCWYELIEERLALSRYLPWTFVSCRTGVRKPDAEAYLLAARTLNVAPGDCLFIDDRRSNCRGAEAVGMPAIQRTDTPSLRRELVARGIIRG